MSIVSRIIGLFAAMEPRDIDRLAPATRSRFAQVCRHWADLAEPPTASLSKTSITHPKSGVLFHLRNGAPRHE